MVKTFDHSLILRFIIPVLLVVVNLENLWKHVEFADNYQLVAILGKKKE